MANVINVRRLTPIAKELLIAMGLVISMETFDVVFT